MRLRTAGVLTLFLCALGVGRAAATRQTEPSPSGDPAVSPLLMKHVGARYSALIRCVKDDRKKYVRVGKRMSARLESMRKAKVTSKTAANRIREATEVLDAFRRFVMAHDQLLAAFEVLNYPQASEAMKQVVTAEERLVELTGKQPERSWLTFDELAEMEASDKICRNRRHGVLPFAREMWVDRKSREKTATSRTKGRDATR